MVTGRYDSISLESSAQLAEEYIRNANVSEDQKANIPGDSDEHQIFQADYAATSLVVLKCFGFADILKQLNGSLIHRLENLMTLFLFH